MIRFAVIAGVGVSFCATAANASCVAVAPSTLQSGFPALGAGTAAALSQALSDVAALADAERRNRSASGAREGRIAQLERQVAEYDARRQASRRPLNFRNGQSLLRSLTQGGQADPPYIAAARSELKAARHNAQSTGGGGGNQADVAADIRLAAAIDRLTRDASQGGSYRMLVDADRLMRERVADCAAWRTASGQGLNRSLDALDRHDQALRGAMTTAAMGAAPRIKAEIAAAGDSGTLQRLRRDYLPTPAATAAMESAGVMQALAARESSIGASERAAQNAAAARRDAEAARAARVQAAQTAREEATERALLARQRAAQGASRPASNGGGSSSGEPSESQMRAALQANAGRVAGRLGMGDLAKITYFEKVGCEKAQGRIGWTCDYLTRMDGNPASGLMDALAGPGTAMRGSARFVLRANGWDAFPDQQ